MPLSKARIRAAVPQYHGTASDEAFDRMFERDKDELRELGIPLVTSVIDPVFDDELGYRIDKREYALPEISFEPDEVAALSLAARTWTRASLAGPAASALRKLRAAGVTMDDSSLVGIEPVVRTTEEAFEPLRRAVRDRRAVTFGYRKPDAESSTRHLQPWGLAQWHGRWYLTGYDLDRGAARVFRVGRIDTTVTASGPTGAYDIPEDHDPRVMVDSTQVPTSPPRVATLRVRDGSGNALRRRARVASDGAGANGANGSNGVAGDGWSSVEVDFRDVDRLADEVAGYGPEVVAVAPTDLTEAVVRRLRGVTGSGELAPEEEL
jgi:proteasome accessory factor B